MTGRYMESNDGKVPLQPPDEKDRRRIELFCARIAPFIGKYVPEGQVMGEPLMLTARVGGRVQAFACARGVWELEVLAVALLSHFMPWEDAGTWAEEWIRQFMPRGGGETVEVTGPQMYCWMATKGMVAPAPEAWKWAMESPRAIRHKDDDDIPF